MFGHVRPNSQDALVDTSNTQKDPMTTAHPVGPVSDSAPIQDVQAQMELSMQRSVTLVFWYKPKCEPIRLHYPIPTFPLFQLSHFPSLTSDLGLASTSYVDVYVPHTGQWEQNLITTVRFVERDQRLLYRIRRSLLDGLSEDDCLGLAEELSMQPLAKQIHSQQPSTLNTDGPAGGSNGALKRPASDMPDPPPASKFYIIDGSQNHPVEPTDRVPTYPQPLLSPNDSPTSPSPPPTSSTESFPSPSTDPSPPSPTYTHQALSVYQTAPSIQLPFRLTTPQGPATSIPYHPHPPLKRWPNDYSVSEIASGFRLMDGLVAQTPTVVQRVAFERVFGCRYVKSTVCRHRGVWRKADAELRAAFEEMGSDERAVWGEFVRRVEGRPPGKGQVVMPVQGQVIVTRPSPVGEPRPGQAGQEKDAVIGSLGPPPPDIAMQANAAPVPEMPSGHVNVYDPALGGDGLQT